MTSVTIELADNGYIVRHATENGEGEPMESIELFEQDNACQNDALLRATWEAIRTLGEPNPTDLCCGIRMSCKCGEDG